MLEHELICSFRNAAFLRLQMMDCGITQKIFLRQP
jgi:hypothetical protein